MDKKTISVISSEDIMNSSYSEAELYELLAEYEKNLAKINKELDSLEDGDPYKDRLDYLRLEFEATIGSLTNYLNLKDQGCEQQGGLNSL